MYLGSTYDAIADAEDAEVEVIRPGLDDAEGEANAARKAALVAAGRESYETWKQGEMARLAPVALKVKTAIEAK